MDEAFVKGRVAARKAANELAELYVSESARLKAAHGLDAAITFLEALRDNLVAIRPFPVETPMPSNGPKIVQDATSREWAEHDLPERFELVELNAECVADTEKAVKIGEHWIPKSQMFEVPEVGDYIEQWPITTWFVEKEDLRARESA